MTGGRSKGEFVGGKFKTSWSDDKLNDGHLRKVVNGKIIENADLLSRNAYLEKQIELLRTEFGSAEFNRCDRPKI